MILRGLKFTYRHHIVNNDLASAKDSTSIYGVSFSYGFHGSSYNMVSGQAGHR